MKHTHKIQFILTPIYICILSVMLIVVSFSWYKVTASANIQVESNEVAVTTEAPKGIDVQLSAIGDKYEYSIDATSKVGTYTVEKKFDTVDTTKVSLTGYFGQYGNEDRDSSSLDKPYIVFFEASITTTKDIIDVNSAFIKKSVVQKVTKDASGKVTNTEQLASGDFTSAADSAYTINFYTANITGNTYKFTNESSVFTPSGTTQTVYLGIKFYPTNRVDKKTSDGDYFLYSNIKYFGSEYVLTACFTNTGSTNS